MSEYITLDFGTAEKVEVLTYGEPGNRTFNITIHFDYAELIIWMEKEQLAYIGVMARHLLDTNEEVETYAKPEATKYKDPNLPKNVEFKASDVSLEYDPSTGLFTLNSRDPGDGENDDQIRNITFDFSRKQGEQISSDALQVVAAGRKLCPLCDEPLTPENNHSCVRMNGHASASDLF